MYTGFAMIPGRLPKRFYVAADSEAQAMDKVRTAFALVEGRARADLIGFDRVEPHHHIVWQGA